MSELHPVAGVIATAEAVVAWLETLLVLPAELQEYAALEGEDLDGAIAT